MSLEIAEISHPSTTRIFAISEKPQKSKHRDLLASLVYPDGKSIHGLLRINASDDLAQGAWRTRLHNLFDSNPNKSLCADPAGFLPRQGTRLAGALRNGDGPVQELLYIRPQFATETPVICSM